MFIFIDESKRLQNGKIVIGGFASYHNVSYINTFTKNKKRDFNIPHSVELKSSNKYGKLFYELLRKDREFEQMEIYSFGFLYEEYFSDNCDLYTNFISDVLNCLLSSFPRKTSSSKIRIIADYINFGNTNKVEKLITDKLGKDTKQNIAFNFGNSTTLESLQLADLFVGKYKEYFLFDDIENLDDLIDKKDIKHKKT